MKLPPQAAGAGVSLKGRSVFATIPDKGHVVLAGSKEAAETVLRKAAGKKTTKLTQQGTAAPARQDRPQAVHRGRHAGAGGRREGQEHHRRHHGDVRREDALHGGRRPTPTRPSRSTPRSASSSRWSRDIVGLVVLAAEGAGAGPRHPQRHQARGQGQHHRHQQRHQGRNAAESSSRPPPNWPPSRAAASSNDSVIRFRPLAAIADRAKPQAARPFSRDNHAHSSYRGAGPAGAGLPPAGGAGRRRRSLRPGRQRMGACGST